MDDHVLMAIIAFAFASAFAIGFFFVIYKMVKVFGGKMEGKPSSFKQHWSTEQLNTVVQLTDAEKRSMKRSLALPFVIVALICGIGFASIGSTYWKYVIQGEKISATVTAVQTYRSGTKRKRTKYIYSLQAVVGGVLVRDTYRSGSYHDADVGGVVPVYATNDAVPELALAAVEERDPVWLLFFATLFGVVVFSLAKQRKQIESGQMKINQLSKAMRRKKLMELENPVTPDGKPVYTIGGSKSVPKEGDDGRSYRIS
jgi:Na+/H+-dicarboxylate symporter